MKTYVCKRCGKSFESNRFSALCKDCRIGKCIICGKTFTRTGSDFNRECCSRECSGKHRAITGKSKDNTAKAMKTRSERYGTLRSDIFREYTKTCKFCGKEFKTKSPRQVYCSGPHYQPCPVCGKPVLIKELYNKDIPACSYECRLEKTRRSNLEKYGSECVFQSDEIKDKIKQTNLKKYGVDHYSRTEEYRNKFKSTMVERYGSGTPLQCPEIAEKIKSTNVSRYGVEFPFMNEEIQAKALESQMIKNGGIGFSSSSTRAKIEETNLARYGYTNPVKNPAVSEKSKSTLIEHYGEDPYHDDRIVSAKRETSLARYGTESPSQSTIVKDRVRRTVQERYGVDCVFQDESTKNKIAETNISKYGVDNPMKCSEIQAKAQQTCLEKYGSVHYKGCVEDIKNTITDPDKYEKFIEFKKDPESYILRNYKLVPTLQDISNDIGCTISTVSYIVIAANCRHAVKYYQSSMELEVLSFLKKFIDENEIVIHDRKTIGPLELDIYIPKYKLAIECDPTYTHNSSKCSFDSETVLSKSYHKLKTDRCEESGIQLIHIFGYNWIHKRNIVESTISNRLNSTKDKIFARKCTVVDVSDRDAKCFLNINHIQGYTSSKVRLGLKLGDEIVSLMTFSRRRNTIGRKSSDTEDDWELSRFCTKLNTNCVGAASKLFKHFISGYNPKSVVSFSDRSFTEGGVYSVLGFIQDGLVDPGYVWVDEKTDLAYNRVQCQKHNLKRFFKDDSIDVENLTEAEIMESRGFVKVYNSGLVRWLWRQ